MTIRCKWAIGKWAEAQVAHFLSPHIVSVCDKNNCLDSQALRYGEVALWPLKWALLFDLLV